MSSLQGYITTDRNTIEGRFGKGNRFSEGGEDKIAIYWDVKFKIDNEIVTGCIYAWKTNGYVPDIHEQFQWNVGGENFNIVNLVSEKIS